MNLRKRENPGWFLWAAVGVLLTAVFMRLYLLQGIPLGLARDEVRNTEIVSAIRQGEHALFFRAGFGHEPLYHYFGVPFQVLLGDNVLSVRLPSVVVGLLLIALVLRWAKRDFGQAAALVAGFGLAVGWLAVIFSRLGLRAISEPLFLVGMAWFWQKRPFVAGLFLGLSLYTYTAARVVFLIPLLFMVVEIVVWQVEKWRRIEGSPGLSLRLKGPVIILITAVLLYLPLYFTLQADPSLQARMQTLAGPLTALQQGDIRPILETTWQALGVFGFAGLPGWTYTTAGLPLFNWFTLLFFYAGLLIALWRIRQPNYALILIWLGVTFLPSAAAPDVIRMIGMLPIIYLLPGISLGFGADKVQPSRRRLVFSAGLVALYFISLTIFTVSHGFVEWPHNEEVRHKYQTILQEMGAHWQAHPAGMMVVVDDFYEPIERRSLRFNMGEEVGSRWVQTSPTAAGAIVLPGEGDGLLYVPEFASPAVDLMAAAGVSEADLLFRNDKRPFFTVYALSDTLELPPDFPIVAFDEKITLLGYQAEAHAENELHVFTYWQVDGTLDEDLTVFVHLMDADGNLISQHDGMDAIPATLQVGDVVVQRHVLPLSNPLPADSYLQTGLYLRDSGVRLTHPGELRDHVILREN